MMMKNIIVFILLIFLSAYAFSQNDTTALQNDTTAARQSSLTNEPVSGPADSLEISMEETDSLPDLAPAKYFDSLKQDTALIMDLMPLDSVTAMKLFFQPPPRLWNIDSIPEANDFVRERFLKDTFPFISDTLKDQVQRLVHYVSAKPIKPVISSFEKKLRDTSLIFYSDSAKQELNDSLFIAVKNLVNYAKKDSFRVCLTNAKNESVCLWMKNKPGNDSSRIRLYDNNGVPAMVWLRKRGKHQMELLLDDRTFIEKPEAQNGIKGFIPMQEVKSSKLGKASDVNIIIGRWIMRGKANLHFNQGYYSDSWVGGGESSIASISGLNFSADYTRGPLKWDNDFQVKLGFLTSPAEEKGTSLRKTEDRIELNSQFGQSAFDNWYFSSMLNLKSQLANGYNYPNDSIPVSSFLAPGYMVFSVGLDHKPSNDFTLLLSPITAKLTYVRDTSRFDQTVYGLDKEEKLKKEVGAYLKTRHKWKVNEDISMVNKVNLFTNYLSSPTEVNSSGVFEKVRSKVDVDWEMSLDFKIGYYMNASINTHLIYDYEVEDKLQFKELLSLGFTYEF